MVATVTADTARRSNIPLNKKLNTAKETLAAITITITKNRNLKKNLIVVIVILFYCYTVNITTLLHK
tara:strand:+ start:5162 stop:5362 length:201 start_codon:yes stop_codon:yes gene_type:complete